MIDIPPTIPSGTFGAFKSPVPSKKSYLSYLIVLVVVLVLGAGVYFFFYQGIGLSFGAPVLPSAPPLTPLDSKIIRLPRFSFDVFDSSLYKSLKSYGNLPIVADSLGRINPFIPY